MPGLEKIGLEAILKDEDFQKGLASYIKGVDLAVSKTDAAGQQMTKSTEAIGKSWQSGAKKAGVAMGAMGAAGVALLTKMTLTAARTEELGIVINTVGRNIGKTEEQMRSYEDGVKSMGITTQGARQALIQMVQANVDLEKSTELARLAQDAAVIAQMDSSQAFQTLITVIQRGSLVMARTLGLTVDFQGAYKRLADELGITTTALTQQQKMLARTNEVLDQSVNIAGTYEAAMGSAGKQLRSMSRHVEELQNELGSNLLPVMGEIVGSVTDLLKTLREMDPVLKQTVVEFGAVASVVLLVGGALTAMAPGIFAVMGALGVAAIPLIAVTALVAGLAALVIHLDNVEKAEQELAAENLELATSYDQYVRSMDDAATRTRVLTEEVYDLIKAQQEAGKAVDFVAYQQASKDLEKYTEVNIRHVEQLLKYPEGSEAAIRGMNGLRSEAKELAANLDEAGLRILAGTDAAYRYARANNASEQAARLYADTLATAARAQLMFNTMSGEAGVHIGRFDSLTGKMTKTVDFATEAMNKQREVTAKVWEGIVKLAQETGLTTEQVRKFKIELGYTDDEIKKVAEDLHLTGKEMDDLAKKTGLSRERIKELNQTMGQKEIEDYGKALKDAAKATGLTESAIDELARSAGWAADDIKAFTGRIEDLEDALGDAKEELRTFFSALTGAMGDVRDANKSLTDSTRDFEQNVSDIRRNVGEDIDAIRQKYDDMLPDRSTGEQRMREAGNVWDEWAHRALGTIDDVVSGDEEGWDQRIRAEAEAVGIIQQDNESVYDYMHRVVKAFYENKIPGLISTEAAGYQALMAEKAVQRDADIADAQAAADEATRIAQQQYNEEQKILRQARNERALLGALQMAEATNELGEFTRATWPGAMGDMLADADTFFEFWQQGLIDMSDDEIAAQIAEWGTDLISTLGATKAEFQDNTKEARIFWKDSKEGAKEAKTEIDAAKQSLIDLKTEQATLEAERGRLAMFGEMDPELEQDLQDVNDQMDDLEDKVSEEGPFGTMTKAVDDTIEKIDTWQERLDAIIEGLDTLGADGLAAVQGVDAATVEATETTDTWHTALDGLTADTIKGFDEIIQQIKDLKGEKIEITVEITTTYNPTVSTAEAIWVIQQRLDALPSQVAIDVQFAGIAAAEIAGAEIGGVLGGSIMNAVLANVEKFRQPWNAPFWLMNRAGQLGRVGQFFAGLYDEDVLTPLRDELEQLNDDIEDTERLLEDQAFIRRLSAQQYLELQTNYNRALEDRNRLEEEYAAAQEATARFERAKSRLDILNAQLQLVKTLYDLDVDPRGILSEIGIGIDVASEDWVAAMAAAMERLAQAAEDKLKEFLGIASPSQKMIDIGLQMREGLVEGLTMPRLMPGGSTTNTTTTNVTNDFSGTVINNGMDMAVFQAMVLQTVGKSMRGH